MAETGELEIDRLIPARWFIASIGQMDGRAILSGISHPPGGQEEAILSSDDGKIALAYSRRSEPLSGGVENEIGDRPVFLLGDDAELRAGSRDGTSANSAVIRLDLKQGSLRVRSSIVGLPPVFVYEHASGIIVTSDLYLLSKVPSIRLRFDKLGVHDLFRIGHPVQHRTLFENVSLMPAGHQFDFDARGQRKSVRYWTPPRPDPVCDWKAFREIQAQAFSDAMRRMDKASTILSLTAGLDTRTILAALVRDGVRLPTVTLSGETPSLDAHIAAKLSRAYGLQHEVVRLDGEFFKRLPEYLVEASRLSGGLSSIEQADEVFFNRIISQRARARLSGNLGNQVGRGGTEKVSMRNADTSLLRSYFAIDAAKIVRDHWYSERGAGSDSLDYEFLLQQEVPFSSVGNYALCNHFLVQQSPYADAALIEAIKHMPLRLNHKKKLSLMQMRLKDLRHRFAGEPEEYSFQRSFIKEVGGFVAECPINWGWKASGGLSPVGVFYGAKSFLDVTASSKGWDSRLTRRLLARTGVMGMHQFKRPRDWFRTYLKEFVHDILLSDRSNTDELLNRREMERQLQEHYSGIGDHYNGLTCALTLCLARKNFSVTS